MNKFTKSIVTISKNTCIIFTLYILCILIVNIITDKNLISNTIVIQSFILSLSATIIQWFAFSEVVIKKLKYAYRNIIFIIPFFIILCIFAYFGNWFNSSHFFNWIIFITVFIVAYILTAIFFLIYFKFTKQKYNNKLKQYKSSK